MGVFFILYCEMTYLVLTTCGYSSVGLDVWGVFVPLLREEI